MKWIASKTINLLTLKKPEIWEELTKLTVRGWRARDLFILAREHPEKFLFANIRIIRIGGKIAAWGLNIFHEKWAVPELQLFTAPKFRRKGLQKRYILPYWNKRSAQSHVSLDSDRQRAVFEYFTNQPEKGSDIKHIQIP
jgi:hypothetical protein